MNNVKTFSFAVAAALLIGSAAPASIVRLGSVADFEPYNYLDDEGVLQCFEAELATLMCQRANLECDWALAPWEDMVMALGENEFEVIMTGMQITVERLETIDFTEEYFPADPRAIMVMTGGLYPDSAAVVGAQVETLQTNYITNQGWPLMTYSAPENAVQAQINNEITAIVGDQAYLEEIIAANPGFFAFVATGVVIGGGIGMGIRKSDSDLKSALNFAIADLKADGTLDALIGPWFNGRDPNYRGQIAQ